MSSIFSKIVSGKIPCYKVAEDQNYLAFLDAFPIVYGHVLVIPKKEVDNILDLDSKEYLGLWEFSKMVATAMYKTIDCKRIGISVIGLEVPHVHVHLIPINKISDIDFTQEKKQFSIKKMTEISKKIKNNLP